MIELYRRFLLELWTGDLDVAPEIVTDDFVGHWPDREVSGPDGLVEVIDQTLGAFSDIRTAIDVGPIVDGDLLAARWTFTARYRGGIPGATAPDGTEVSFHGADVIRVSADGGRIAEYWVSSDGLSLMAQLGALEG
jgi:predicted ester cyclase